MIKINILEIPSAELGFRETAFNPSDVEKNQVELLPSGSKYSNSASQEPVLSGIRKTAEDTVVVHIGYKGNASEDDYDESVRTFPAGKPTVLKLLQRLTGGLVYDFSNFQVKFREDKISDFSVNVPTTSADQRLIIKAGLPGSGKHYYALLNLVTKYLLYLCVMQYVYPCMHMMECVLVHHVYIIEMLLWGWDCISNDCKFVSLSISPADRFILVYD